VLLQITAAANPDQVVALREGLLALPASIPEIRRLSFGPNLAAGAEAWPWVLVVELDDMAALARYADHPAHRRVLDKLLNPIRQDRLAVDVGVDSRLGTRDS
jgi:hypothetical protein